MKSLEEIKNLFIATLEEDEQWFYPPNGISINGIIKNSAEKFIVLFTDNNWINKSVWDYCYSAYARYRYKDICIAKFEEHNNTFKRYFGSTLEMNSIGKEQCFSSFKGKWSITNSSVYYFGETSQPVISLAKSAKSSESSESPYSNPRTIKDLHNQIKQMVSRRVDELFGNTHPAESVANVKNDLYYQIDVIFKNVANGLTSMKNVINDSSFFYYDLKDRYRVEGVNIIKTDTASMIEDFNTKKL